MSKFNIDSMNFTMAPVERFVEKSVRNEPFVRFGLDNMEVERWLEYVDYSPIHAACVRSKVDNAAGMGFAVDYKINQKQTLNDVIKQIFFEFVVTGNLYLEIIWRKDRSEGISGFHIIPSKFIRAKQPENYELESDAWYYSRDWLNWRKAGIIEFTSFNPNDYESRQIIQIKNYSPGYLFYGVPDYLSSMLDIQLSRAISSFNLNNIQNGASPSLWVHLPHAPDSQNEQDDILQRLEARYRGSENAGRIVVSYGGEGERPEITQIQPTMQTGGYAEIFALVRENILAGHKIVDGSIIGLPSPTGFNSSADQLDTTYKLFMNTSIKPMQEFILRELRPVMALMYPNEEINLEIQQNNIL